MESDEWGESSLFGPQVLVVRTLSDGDPEQEWLPAGLAVDCMLNDPRNGVDITSARVVWFEVSDLWGGSM